MSKLSFCVSLSPYEAFKLVRDEENAELVHEEWHDIDDSKQIGTLVFEKYYFRSKNRAALVIIFDNFQGSTEVRAIATGSSEGMIFNFDWGAADNFAQSVQSILDCYVIED